MNGVQEELDKTQLQRKYQAFVMLNNYNVLISKLSLFEVNH